jgi:hypothetical protein
MTEDILSQAARALRETTEGEDASARFTRARVMASVHQSRRRRGLRSALLIPLAAVLFGSSAWGAASGRLPAVLHAVVQLVVGGPEVEAPPTEPAAPAAPKAAARAPAPAAPVDESVTDEPGDRDGEPTIEERAPDAAPTRAKAPPAVLRPSARRAAIDPEGPGAYAAYRRAHAAHFGAQDPAAALAAWDDYLRVAPGGRFALEATYNRALCLVRLGRQTEARAALRPFADGTYGAYRRREARELLDALGAPSAAAGSAAP